MRLDHPSERVGGDAYDDVLRDVQKPVRYIGGEWNEVVKDHDDVALTFALAFPDVYEIGMSHLGFRILYSLINNRNDTAAERVCCPWPDMADALRKRDLPLASLETRRPLGEFDVVGFSLQYEMTFTNVLEMLDLARIPLRSSRRGPDDPLVAVGGPVVFNVEPLADFVDLVFIGDGEEMVGEFLDLLRDLKAVGASRERILREAARIEGIYVPSLYDVERDPRTGLLIPQQRTSEQAAPYPVMRRILMDLDDYPFPDRIIVPHGEIVHDRVSVELMRGCPVGCRFCQAGYVYRPTRERDPNQVRDTVIRSVRATGYDQFSLSSLNTGEYGSIHPVMFDLMDRFAPEKVSVNLSSMHASTITPELAEQVRRVRKSGFTIAPEAGTQRMRDVINKNLDEEQILKACRLAFEAGWDHIKLYFMIGLPTETDADIDGLVDLAQKIADIGRGIVGKSRRPLVTMSASSFIPKAETPFQWLGMDRIENLYRKQDRIAARVSRGVRFKHHACETSFLEGVFSRGDRSLGNVLERAWRNGARFDGWDEIFNKQAWGDAFRDEGVDPEFFAHTDFPADAPLPWHVVHSRINRKWLAIELKRAMEAATLSICGPKDCHGCAPFARDCVKGIVSETTDRPLDNDLPLLSTPAAPGPGVVARADRAPQLSCFPTPAPPPPPAVETVDKNAEVAPSGADEPTNPAPPEKEYPAQPRYRYRARFTKLGRLRFLGHLDLTRMLMRAMRRADVTLVYSEGFNPKPRVAFGPALSVGVASESEYVDFESHDRLDPLTICERINAVLPPGIRFEGLRSIRRDAPSLGEIISAARYRVHTGNGFDLSVMLDGFRSRGPITVEREVVAKVRKGGRRGRGRSKVPSKKTRRFELDQEILGLEQIDGEAVRLTLMIHGGAASVRPEEVLTEIFGVRCETFGLVREDVLADWNGRLLNPMLAAATSDVVRTSV